ncbi:hypothetical protein ACIOYV_01585 [Pseudomonas sp. NPDC087342]|uniref:hypothetical protein n=1 Tax=Pseudomonas sp. NPDC087342 TaxID=3364437 RepID=UPI0038027A32
MSTFVRSLTVEIFNSSGADIAVNYAQLTGREWAIPPTPGTLICPSQQQAYVNGVSNTLSSLGGQISLMPASGGSITSAWNWPSGSPVSGSVNSIATNLAVTHQISNTQTNNPTMQIVIANASSIAKIV